MQELFNAYFSYRPHLISKDTQADISKGTVFYAHTQTLLHNLTGYVMNAMIIGMLTSFFGEKSKAMVGIHSYVTKSDGFYQLLHRRFYSLLYVLLH